MTIETKNQLESKVQAFLEKQPKYELYKDLPLEAIDDGPGVIGVIFSRDIQSGIAGFGKSVEEAYDDFIYNWKRYKGFEHVEKHQLTARQIRNVKAKKN